MKAHETKRGQKITWAKESRTFTGTVEKHHPSGAVVLVDVDGLRHAIPADRDVEVVT